VSTYAKSQVHSLDISCVLLFQAPSHRANNPEGILQTLTPKHPSRSYPTKLEDT